MRTLNVHSLSTDGSHAVLSDETGQHYRLPVDERLRAALRGESLADTQLSLAVSSDLGPREIQARVRAGTSPSVLSEQSGLPLERVMRFAAPVLDERAHIARRALTALVRDEGMLELGTLADVTARALRDRGVTEAVAWDAWRRHDGRWLVSSRWTDGEAEHTALWLLDATFSSASPLDANARSLTGMETPAPKPTRLAVVRGSAQDEPDAGVAADGDVGDDSGDGEVGDTVGDEDRPDASGEPVSTDDTPTGPVPTVSDAGGSPGPAHPAHRGVRARDRDDDGLLRLSDIADRVEEHPARRRSSPGDGASYRPAVPSWDEIMFGRRS
jgi:hypothetical protein